MANFSLVKQLRQDSKDFDDIYKNDEDSRHAYDEFVLGVSEKAWGKLLKNGKRFDASSALSLYEMSVSIDQRIITQAIETSYLRKNFDNFPSESLFDEYTGINPTENLYMPIQLGTSGWDLRANGKIKPSTNPNEIKTIKSYVSSLRRPVKEFKEGFELTLGDLELASYRNIPLQDRLTSVVARDLMMQEQDFAFNYTNPGTYVSPEENGVFNNSAISSAFSWSAGPLLNPATTGRAIIDEFVRIRGLIQSSTKNVFKGMNQKLCFLISIENMNILTKTYSDLEGKDALSFLTEREFRLAGLPIIGNNQCIAYYKDFENIEISTARMVEALPQSYDAKTTSWFFPFRNVTAGLTVKRSQAVYLIPGMNP